MSGVDLSTLNKHQLKIAQTLDAPLFVEAGAGSGKTFTLTRRVAWALSPGSGADGEPMVSDLGQVLVITFTNAAATEIRERVRSTLFEAGMREAALSVDSAWISTIHGMCRRILARNAFDLGLDPNFDICTTLVASELLELATEQVVGAARRESAHDPMYARVFEELEYRGVVDRVRKITEAANKAPQGFEGLYLPGGDDVSETMERLLMAYEALGGAKLSKAARESVIPSLEALRSFAELAPGARTVAAARSTLSCCTLPRPSKAIADLLAEARAELAHAKAQVILEATRELAPALLDLARRTDERYAEIKRSASLLDNDDLITMALRALEENPAVAARYAGRFRLVMVDEFQDTDIKQLRLISILAGASGTEVPEHLATVGDAQQSIYRFRGADVDVFRNHGARVGEAGLVRLAVNYRSHRDVLAFVERVCGGERGVLDGFMHLDDYSGRDDGYKARELPRISVEICGGKTHGGKPSRQQRALLAAQVADRLARLRDAGESPGGMALLLGVTTNAALYIDALRARGLSCIVTGGSTFTKAPEVAVMLALLRTLANPANTQSGLFPLLASDMFGLDANDFVQLGTRAQEKLDAPTKRTIDKGLQSMEFFHNAEPSLRLAAAHAVLERAWASLGTRPVADVCMDALRDSGWLSRLEQQGAEGLATEANLLAAVRYIRDLTSEMGLGPVRAAQEFARWLEESKVPPAAFNGSKQDAVRIMTIHASKGLEFPVVAVAECWNKSQSEGGVLVGSGPEGSTALVVRPNESTLPAKEKLKLAELEALENPCDIAEWAATLSERETAADEQEKARLLYVALTRAREALVLGISAPSTSKGLSEGLALGTLEALMDGALPAPGEYTLDYGGSGVAALRYLELTAEDGEFVSQGGGALPCAEGTLPGEPSEIVRRGTPLENASLEGAELQEVELYAAESLSYVDEVRMRSQREGVYSYSSALAHEGKKMPSREERERTEEGEASTSDADKATSLGSAFHALAQVMVETGREPDEERVEAVCRRWGVSVRQRARLDAALARWSRSDLRREVLGWPLVRAEVPFFSLSPSVFCAYGDFAEGAIDLLATKGGACEGPALVLDYKTGDRGLDEEQIRARHVAQAKLYAEILLSQGFSSVSCVFVCVELERDDGQPFSVRYDFPGA